MTGPAQHHLIIGAVCIDEQFRTELFADAGAGDDRERIARILTAYEKRWQVAFDDPGLVDDIVRLVKGPCKNHVLEKLTALRAAACPCWPCLVEARRKRPIPRPSTRGTTRVASTIGRSVR